MVLTQLTDFCEQHAIRNMALKGSYIKRFYPQPEMRYMVDIDFLIQQDCENAVHAFLLKNGVKEIPAKNETFNTDVHEAITTFPAPSDDLKGKIIDCVSKGYTLNDKVIRFSKVVVGE